MKQCTPHNPSGNNTVSHHNNQHRRSVPDIAKLDFHSRNSSHASQGNVRAITLRSAMGGGVTINTGGSSTAHISSHTRPFSTKGTPSNQIQNTKHETKMKEATTSDVVPPRTQVNVVASTSEGMPTNSNNLNACREELSNEIRIEDVARKPVASQRKRNTCAKVSSSSNALRRQKSRTILARPVRMSSCHDKENLSKQRNGNKQTRKRPAAGTAADRRLPQELTFPPKFLGIDRESQRIIR
jgi:hypothetical protein